MNAPRVPSLPLANLSLGWRRRLPMMLQTEATECGLACLGMIAGYHGYRSDIATLRNRFPVSLKGATLAQLIAIAGQLQLATRPLKVGLNALPKLRLPCVLHWDFNHFVVLKQVTPDGVVIHDPAVGERRIAKDEVSKRFTGVVLELWPDANFQPEDVAQRVRLRDLLGRVSGLGGSLGQILALALALEIFALASPLFMQWVIDNVLVSADRDLLTTLALGFGLLMLLQQAVSFVRSWVMMYVNTTLNLQWRANVFTHLLRLPVQYFEKRHLGDVVSRFGSIDTIQRTLTTSFLEAILDGAMTILTLTLMFIYSPTLAWIAVGAMVLYGLIRWAWYRPLREATEEQIIHAAKQETHFLESMRGIKAIKLFQRHEVRRASWLTVLVEQINADLHTQKLGLYYRTVNGLLFGLENILVIWLGATLVLDGNFTVGVLMAFHAYKNQFDGRVSSLIDKFFEVRMLQLQGQRLADIVFTEPEPDTSGTTLATPSPVAPSIEVSGLRFRYSEQEPWVLDDAGFRIGGGESVAIVGPSGGGKTTLVNVLLGILPAAAGEIRVNGTPLGKLGTQTMRQMVGTVMQDDVLFAGSIADNISFFDPEADMAWIEECARIAAIHDDIAAMPMAYNTLVGDMGTVLSGGQRQRVLLARAVYRRPSILVLDEATSHLDVERESQVNAAIGKLAMTRIIIAHRPETIASADRVLILTHGKVFDAATLDAAVLAPQAAETPEAVAAAADTAPPETRLDAVAATTTAPAPTLASAPTQVPAPTLVTPPPATAPVAPPASAPLPPPELKPREDE